MPCGATGIWCGFFDDIKSGDLYKYSITAPDGTVYLRSDPYAVYCELRPGTASVAYEKQSFKWSDKAWIKKRSQNDSILVSYVLIYNKRH